ncbi:MAG: hypothetical protein LBN24_13640 [Mediterranea sp.]|jgi:hypothetical protein|nr:hypothetical protein [Mediterranea sp.]
MKRIWYLLACLLPLVSACHHDDEPVLLKRTVLVYIAGDNSLGANGFPDDDLAEIKQGVREVNAGNYNLLVYFDNVGGSSGDYDRLVRINQNGEEELIHSYPSQNSVDINVMKDVLNEAFSRYPAESYGLVLWSHGDGWMKSPSSQTRWWGQDYSGSSYMSIADLHTALAAAPHLDFILFDACFMQAVEVAYQLRDRASYIIGSPTEIPGPGAPYQTMVPAMFSAGNAESVAMATASAYYDYYQANYENLSSEWEYGASLSVVDTSQLEALAAATASILPKYIQGGASISTSGILDYDRRAGRTDFVGYYDLDGFIRSVASNADYQAWHKVFGNAVKYAKSTATNYSQFAGSFLMTGFAGLSSYIPRADAFAINSYYQQHVDWYSVAGWSQTGW